MLAELFDLVKAKRRLLYVIPIAAFIAAFAWIMAYPILGMAVSSLIWFCYASVTINLQRISGDEPDFLYDSRYSPINKIKAACLLWVIVACINVLMYLAVWSMSVDDEDDPFQSLTALEFVCVAAISVLPFFTATCYLVRASYVANGRALKLFTLCSPLMMAIPVPWMLEYLESDIPTKVVEMPDGTLTLAITAVVTLVCSFACYKIIESLNRWAELQTPCADGDPAERRAPFAGMPPYRCRPGYIIHPKAEPYSHQGGSHGIR